MYISIEVLCIKKQEKYISSRNNASRTLLSTSVSRTKRLKDKILYFVCNKYKLKSRNIIIIFKIIFKSDEFIYKLVNYLIYTRKFYLYLIQSSFIYI